MSCRRWRKQMLEAIHGWLDEPCQGALERHLESCSRCSEEHAALQATLRLVDADRQRLFAAASHEHAWNRLVPALDAIDTRVSNGRSESVRPAAAPRWRLAWAPVTVALAALGIWLVVHRTPSAPTTSTSPAVAVKRGEPAESLEARFDHLLVRARPLLFSFSNRDPKHEDLAAVDTGAERRLAARLALEARALRLLMRGDGCRWEHALLTDLEIMFLQVANLEGDNYLTGMGLVREALDQREVLLALDMVVIRRAQRPDGRKRCEDSGSLA